MAKASSNIAASIRQKLLNLSRKDGRVFDVVLVTFGLERLIHRLSISPHKDKFVLKGGMLVTLWTADHGRYTRDIDFLGFGVSDMDAVKDIFREILKLDAADGLVFDADALTAAPIREDQIYGGMRLKTTASLGKTLIPITIDIGFGDALTAPNYTIDYPSVLDFPVTTIRAYSPATVMAEKFQALVALGLVNGRMKDYHDLWAILQVQSISKTEMMEALRQTFERRDTPIPQVRPDGLTDAFANDPAKRRQWLAYAESIELEEVSLRAICGTIWDWFEPICAQDRA